MSETKRPETSPLFFVLCASIPAHISIPPHTFPSHAPLLRYIDGLLDLLLVTDDVVDHLRTNELLFLGPDERTAGFMSWAALHAQKRGYPFWSAFTTGKPRRQEGDETCM